MLLDLLMISTFMSDVSIFGVDGLVANFAGVGDIKVLPMDTLNVVLHSMRLAALLPTLQTSVPRAGVASDKVLELGKPLYNKK